jgi:carbon monoxide dehydrogenase subunit G
MNLEAQKIIVQKSPKEIFELLTDLKNFEGLMPENKEKFEVDGNSFIFGLKGMPEIRLVLEEQIEYSKIVLGAAGGKLDFSLIANIVKIDTNKSDVQLSFSGDFNPMMAMMIKSPLQKFINTLTENIEKL